MDAVGHGKVVLSGIVGPGGSVRVLDYAAARLEPGHFTDKVQRELFEALTGYADRFGGIMPQAALGDRMRDRPPGQAAMYEEMYGLLAGQRPEQHEFKHSVDQLADLAVHRATGEALAVGMAILNPRPGEEIRDDRTREVLAGHEAARAYVLAEFAAAERASGSASPEGNVADDGAAVLESYERAREMREAGKVPGIRFGLPSLDRYLGSGLQCGEMGLIVADTTAGKSSMCVNTAWYNAVECGLNVVIFTTEQLFAAVRVKLVARHSRHPKFGLRNGLNDADIRSGGLTGPEEKALRAVVADLKGGGYGIVHVVQMPEVATVPGMAARFSALRRQFRPDLVIADYLQLFSPVRSRRDATMREDQSGVIKSAARWCASCDDGRGVAFISPWQANNDGVNSLKSSGKFGLSHVSETKEAARTPGLVLALANPEDDESGGREASLRIHVLKNRGGPRGRQFPITADYANSYFWEQAGGGPEVPLDLDGF